MMIGGYNVFEKSKFEVELLRGKWIPYVTVNPERLITYQVLLLTLEGFESVILNPQPRKVNINIAISIIIATKTLSLFISDNNLSDQRLRSSMYLSPGAYAKQVYLLTVNVIYGHSGKCSRNKRVHLYFIFVNVFLTNL